MIRINLGRLETAKKKKKKASVPQIDSKAILLFGTSIAFAFLPYLFFVQYRAFVVLEHDRKMKESQEKIDGIKEEVSRLKSYKAEMESYEQQKRIVTERLAVVKQLLESRNTPVSILDAVSQSLSPRAWLSNIELATSPEPKVTISGNAFSNDDVSDFVDKLSDSIHLSEVNLDGVDASTGQGMRDKRFTIFAVPKGVFPSTPARSNAGAPGQPPGQAKK